MVQQNSTVIRKYDPNIVHYRAIFDSVNEALNLLRPKGGELITNRNYQISHYCENDVPAIFSRVSSKIHHW